MKIHFSSSRGKTKSNFSSRISRDRDSCQGLVITGQSKQPPPNWRRGISLFTTQPTMNNKQLQKNQKKSSLFRRSNIMILLKKSNVQSIFLI